MSELRRSAYFLFAAITLLVVAVTLFGLELVPEAIAKPLVLGGGFMLFDWTYGIGTFRQLLSLPRTIEEDDLPEQMLYSPRLAARRCGLIAAFIGASWLAYPIFGTGNWEAWSFIGAAVAYFIVLLFHSQKAIEMAAESLRNGKG